MKQQERVQERHQQHKMLNRIICFCFCMYKWEIGWEQNRLDQERKKTTTNVCVCEIETKRERERVSVVNDTKSNGIQFCIYKQNHKTKTTKKEDRECIYKEKRIKLTNERMNERSKQKKNRIGIKFGWLENRESRDCGSRSMSLHSKPFKMQLS